VTHTTPHTHMIRERRRNELELSSRARRVDESSTSPSSLAKDIQRAKRSSLTHLPLSNENNNSVYQNGVVESPPLVKPSQVLQRQKRSSLTLLPSSSGMVNETRACKQPNKKPPNKNTFANSRSKTTAVLPWRKETIISGVYAVYAV